MASTLPAPSRSVLGKRKAAPTSFVPHFQQDSTSNDSRDSDESESESSSSSSSEKSQSDFDEDEQNDPSSESEDEDLLGVASNLRVQGGGGAKRKSAGSSTADLILVNGKLVSKTKRRYACTWEGCAKAYTKPTRLAEHERSHTGERPFQCTSCDKSYLRETHLAAHVRSHRFESEKAFNCSHEGCGKRFWTGQHLRRHEEAHSGDKPFVCDHDRCGQAFAKNHQLRKHVANDHSPPGTKPFRCPHDGCTKSFATSQKLQIHSKVHQPDRYACSLGACLSQQDVFFQTWSALQAHIRDAHPPTCPYPECDGRTFTTQKGLKGHMKVHEDAEYEHEAEIALDEGEDGAARKRRRGGEMDGDWACEHAGCKKTFKSKKALTNHRNTAHLGLRPFKCDFPSCGQSFGYKHVLQRHAARHHAPPAPVHPPAPPANTGDADVDAVVDRPSIIHLLTGVVPTVPPGKPRNIRCPWPDLLVEPYEPTKSGSCRHVSGRAYDLRRHLKAAHGFEVDLKALTGWLDA